MAQNRSSALALAVGVVVAGAALLFFSSFEGPWTLRGENKISLFPMSADAWRQWRSGHFPSWTSGMFGGFPLFAGSQSSALYLPHALAFASTPAPHWRAMDVAVALHAGFLAAGCVRLLLQLGTRLLPALLGAGLVLCASQVVYWTSFVPMFAALAWWPWLLLAADRLGQPDRHPLGPIVLGAVALAAQALAGYAEFALYGGCFAAVWLLAARASVPFAVRCARLALLGASGGLLAAPQLLPTALALEGGAREGIVQLAQSATGIAALVDPREGGRLYGLPTVFLGAATLALAACALALRARRAVLLGGMALLTALLAFGSATPLYAWLQALPVFELFRTPFKLFLATELFVALLAALGADALAARGSRAALAVAGLLGAAAFAEHAAHLSHQLPLVASPHVRSEVRVPDDLAGFEALLPDLLPGGPGPPPRVLHVGWPGSFGSLGEVYGVESILGSSPALLGSRQAQILRRTFTEGVGWIDRDWLHLLGVELVVVRGACARFPGRGLEHVRDAPGECLLRNPTAPPRFELLAAARPVADEETELARVLDRPGAPVPVVAVSGGAAAPAWRAAGALAPGEGVETLAYRPGAFRLRATSRRERLLLVREARDAGWSAQVAGRAARILPAAGLFFAVEIPAGRHDVDVRYEVRGLSTGLALAGAWIAAVGVLRWRRGRGVFWPRRT